MILGSKRPVAVTLAAGAIAALAGCATPFSQAPAPVAVPNASAIATVKAGAACPGQAGWSLRAEASLKALYADTEAVAADAAANNTPGVAKAGRKLASDAIAAATLPLPPAAPASWKALTAAYAAAGTALAAEDATSAVPQLEAGNSAAGTFSSTVAKCLAVTW
jgi:hypothetical protein